MSAPQPSSTSRYVIVEKIAEGGSGAVFRGWDQELQRHVAIKRLKADAQIEAEIREEARLIAALQHPNIVSVFDVGVDAEGTFIVMELVTGQTLDDFAGGQKLPIPMVLDLADQLCRGLAAAHARGFVHHDFKPGNVMLQFHDDRTFTAKILDFGLAKAVHESVPALEGDVLGSIYTIAPEQLRSEPVDTRTDIYSLGCVLYFSLLGHFPYEKETVQEIVQCHLFNHPTPAHLFRPEVPKAVSDLIARMMAHQPADRPQTVKEIRAVFKQSAGRPNSNTTMVLSTPQPPAPTGARVATNRVEKAAKKTSWLWLVILPAALAVIGGAAIFWSQGGGKWWENKQKKPAKTVVQAPVEQSTPEPTPDLPKINPLDVKQVASRENQEIIVEGTVLGCEHLELLAVWKLKFTTDDSGPLVIHLGDSKFKRAQAEAFVKKRVRVTGTVTYAIGNFRMKVETPTDIKVIK